MCEDAMSDSLWLPLYGTVVIGLFVYIEGRKKGGRRERTDLERQPLHS